MTGIPIATRVHVHGSQKLPHIPGAPYRAQRRDRPEDRLQANIVTFLRAKLPRSRFQVFMVSNGATKLSPRAGKRLKDMGLLAGVPDIAVCGRNGRAWFLEVKTDEGRLSPDQRDFHAWCEVNSFPCEVVRSIGDVERLVAEWGLLSMEVA